MTDQEIETTKASFFATIAADRRNDNNRLVFADWAEENGLNELASMLRGGSRQWFRELALRFCPYDTEGLEPFDFGVGGRFHGIPKTPVEKVVDRIIDRALDGHFTAHGSDLHGIEEGWQTKEFWEHLQVMTGINFSPEYRENFGWSCSC